jgi:TRAP-type C4-dicarboxylate transport system substrate-binding protein
MLAAAAVIGGCSAPAVDKSGVAGIETLLLANNDAILGGVPAVEQFVQQLESLSRGAVHVEVTSLWGGGGDEGRVVKDVAAGKADLGWVGTRVLDTVGVNAFQPLHAPFLLSTHSAQAALVRDPLARDLMTSLRPLGITGLALLADELRRPAAAHKPLLGPEDFRGLSFGTPPSEVQQSGLRALGAHDVASAFPKGPQVEALDAIDTMWWTYRGNAQWTFAPIVTGNLALWPRTTVLFANAKRLEALPPAARGWVQEAARRATEWSAAHAGEREAAEIAVACHSGARIATATDLQLKALRLAAEPAYAALRRDPSQAGALARLEELVGQAGPDAPVTVPDGCAYRPGDQVADPVAVPALQGPGNPGKLPRGTYRYSFSEEELRGSGMTAEEARANAGVWTWTLGAGRWSYVLKQSSSDPPEGYGGNFCEGYYDVEGDLVSFTRLTVYPQGDCAPPTWFGRWAPADQGVRWTQMQVDSSGTSDALFGGKVWVRIG